MNINPSTDKSLHDIWYVGCNYYPFLNVNVAAVDVLELIPYFIPHFFWNCDYLSMLRKKIYVNKMPPPPPPPPPPSKWGFGNFEVEENPADATQIYGFYEDNHIRLFTTHRYTAVLLTLTLTWILSRTQDRNQTCCTGRWASHAHVSLSKHANRNTLILHGG